MDQIDAAPRLTNGVNPNLRGLSRDTAHNAMLGLLVIDMNRIAAAPRLIRGVDPSLQDLRQGTAHNALLSLRVVSETAVGGDIIRVRLKSQINHRFGFL
jgi:hypothetical protein